VPDTRVLNCFVLGLGKARSGFPQDASWNQGLQNPNRTSLSLHGDSRLSDATEVFWVGLLLSETDWTTEEHTAIKTERATNENREPSQRRALFYHLRERKGHALCISGAVHEWKRKVMLAVRTRLIQLKSERRVGVIFLLKEMSPLPIRLVVCSSNLSSQP